MSHFIAGLLLIVTTAWADDWSKKNKDDFNVRTDDVDTFVNVPDSEPTPPIPEPEIPETPVEELEPEKPVEIKKEEKKIEKTDDKKTPQKVEKKPLVYKDLKSTPATLPNGSRVEFSRITIFSCLNLVNRNFLFNKKQTAHCQIKNAADFARISKKIGSDAYGKNTVSFESCPVAMASEKICDPSVDRNF